jgi:DNA-binding transcriptional ArsR family regulator
MPKVTLDMSTFKALASDTRLNILRALDGKKMSLKDISKITRLNKATLHEHLTKLNEAGLVKRYEREGHKWVYYKLTWRGEGLLHPENTKIVVLFTMTFITLAVGLINLFNYIKGEVVGKAVNNFSTGSTALYELKEKYGSSNPPIHEQFRSLISTETDSVSQIAEVPLQNQTLMKLSNTFLENAEKSKGFVGNSLSYSDVHWCAEDSSDVCIALSDAGYNWDFYNATTNLGIPPEGAVEEAVRNGIDGGSVGLTNTGSSVPESMVAVVHDPAFQYIAIACIAIFSVLICFSVYKLYKNRKPKL